MQVFNINDYVEVLLTSKGEEVYRQSSRVELPLKKSSDGRVQFQLWHLMEVFGPRSHCGADQMFVKNEVRLTK